MKFSISQKALAKTINAASRVAQKNASIPILTHVLLEATGATLSIRATDLDMEVASTCEAYVQQGGSVCVSAAQLRDIASRLPEGSDVKLEVDDGRMTIRAGRARFHISTLPAQDWPEIAGTETPHSFDMSADLLARMFAKVMFAVSTEQTRFYLHGPYVHIAGDKLRMVATDGHRLSRVDTELPAGAEGIPGVIVPREAVLQVERLLKDAETVTIGLSENFIVFRAGSTVLTSKLIDGTFPDYARVIPTGCDKRAVLDADELSRAVARVSTVSSDRGRAVKMAFADDTLSLSVSNAEIGEAADEIEAAWPHEPFATGFNSAYVQECVTALGCEKLAMRFQDAGSPCLFTSESDKDTLIVLMPMRV